MKSYLKLGLITAGLTAILIMGINDATAQGYTTNSSLPSGLSRLNLSASSSNAVIVALNAQSLLLNEIVQEHQSRAADLAQKGQSEKAKWEADLVNELQEKSARLQKSIEQQSQPLHSPGALNRAGGEIDDQLAFVTAIETRLDQVHQALSAAIADSQNLSLQIATNKVPENTVPMSYALGDNQKLVKDLQKEQFDLELRKLELKALRKLIQK